MSKTRSISDLVTELQRENDTLKGLKSLFNQAVKREFGYDIKTIHTLLSRGAQLERKFAELKSAQQARNNNTM